MTNDTPNTLAPGPRAPSGRGLEVLCWLALAGLLLLLVPLFLRMPTWTDVAFYDICARHVLRGGALERDFLFLPPPGFVWARIPVRSLLGYSDFAVRLADLAVVSAIVALLALWLRALGLSRAARVGVAAALLAFYLTTSEFVHCQPDVWMLLPALVALDLRRRRVAAPGGAGFSPRRATAWALLEGVCWGAGCLIKPYVVVPGLLTWLASAALLRRSGPGWVRRLAWDAGGLVAGGLLMAALWQAWLLAHGTWGDYWRNYAEFHDDYYSIAPAYPQRLYGLFFAGLWPWGWVHLVALPIALLVLFGSVARLVRPARPSPGPPVPSLALLLSAFYLGWLAQASLLQFADEYHAAPTILLALTLIAGCLWRPGTRWPGVFLFAFVAYAVVCQPACRPERLALWGRCWTERSSPQLRAELALRPDAPDWVELGQVADYLRGRQVGEGELLCYFAHACHLYIDTGLTPPTRFLIPDMQLHVFRAHGDAIRREVRAGPQRYVVTDVGELGRNPGQAPGQSGQPLALPPGFSPERAASYPFSEPVVFRAGRYYVHRVAD